MKTTLKIIILLTTYLVGAQNLKLEQTTLNWTGKAAFSNYELTGSLKTKSGMLTIENDSITTLSVTIDMKSLNHENKDLKNHLRGKDFFEVKKYNEATFTLTNPIVINKNKATLIGYMTIKGITKQEIIEINISSKKDETTVSFNCVIDRTIYGVTFNSPSLIKKLKENAIADKFKLKGKLKFKL